MPTNIDEAELARLEYLIEASGSCGYSTNSDDPNMQYLAAACHYTPALVAEVRRLREENVSLREDVYALNEAWGYEYEANQRHEHMVAELMETVEAWRGAAEFESIVAAKLTRLDAEDLPCANSMGIFCPRAPFRGRNCGPWCLLRMARIDAEEEMKKHADRE